jgi:soluble cytochrome b562
MIRAAIVAAALSLSGCALLEAPTPAAVDVRAAATPAAKAQAIINELNVDILAAAVTVNNNEKDGVYTALEAAGYRAELRRQADAIDKAQALLRAGDITSAQGQIELAKRALLEFRKTIATRARQ